MIIPAVVAALVLGVAFDVPSLTTKPYYIFDSNAINNSIVSIHNPYTKSRYRLIETSSESNDFLSVDGELALKAKYGWEGNLQGIGKYLTHPINRKKTIELLCTVYHETVAETFPTYTQQREEWKSKQPGQVGTHYIRSVIYGGQLVISYKLIVDKEENMEEIKAGVDAAIAKSGSFDAHVAGNLELVNSNFGNISRVEISAYATTGVFSPPSTLENVLTLIREYPDMVKKVNNGKGSPVRVDIEPLSSLDSKFTAFARLGGMDSVYNDAINKLEDMKVADKEFKEWESTKMWNDEQQAQIDKYYTRLRTAFSSMKRAISSMDTKNGVTRDHFDQAFKDYGYGPENIPNRYTRELSNLTHHVENIPFYWYPYTTATTHYIHWGSINCSLPSSEPVYVGYAASSPKGFGNGGNILCLDIDPQFESTKEYNGSPLSRLTGLTYETPSKTTGFAYCAFCRLENATAVEVVAGRNSCPPDMKLEYTGYLATNLKANSGSICMAEQPDDKIVNLHAKEDSSAGMIVPLWVKCEECEGDEDWEKGRYVSCAVCSR